MIDESVGTGIGISVILHIGAPLVNIISCAIANSYIY